MNLDQRIRNLRRRIKKHPQNQHLEDRLRQLQQRRSHQGQPAPNPNGGQQNGGPGAGAPNPNQGFPTAKPHLGPMPYSVAADTAIQDARTQYEQQTANLAGQQLQVQQQYGIAPGYNDPLANPYSQAALLQADYDRRQRVSSTNYAAHGQLYAGSLQNARDTNRSNYGISYNALNDKYMAALADIENQRTSAGLDYTRAKQDAYAQALEDALNQPLDPTEYPLLTGRKKKGKPKPPPKRKPRNPNPQHPPQPRHGPPPSGRNHRGMPNPDQKPHKGRNHKKRHHKKKHRHH